MYQWKLFTATNVNTLIPYENDQRRTVGENRQASKSTENCN